jgi:diaminohydroxyphosphoribosylaminopyrimidine deaminase/5-amino-6-(5-phosphoribosylamino)uracil reductase
VVLDSSGAVVGEGRTADGGRPHAEVVALTAAGARARGGTAVVTLEPCAHTGGTPPCIDALVAAGVARVVVAVRDPHPAAAGGADALRAKGIDVEIGLLASEAAHALRAWLHGVRTGRPYVTWKFAATLDGRTAAADGSSRWITSAEARADVHRLRAEADTIVAGVGTVLADDPQLTVRRTDGTPAQRQPLRVVVDTHGRTPAGARVRDSVASTLIATAADHPGPDGRVDLTALLHRLYTDGRRHVFVEGGATLAGAFVSGGLVDEVVAYLAPALLGDGTAALGAAGITSIDEALRLDVTEVVRVGSDVRITATPRPAGTASHTADQEA